MKQQEIFNKAAVHLMGMDGPSLDADGDACVYRGRHGSCEYDGGLGELSGQMCAVGVFIKEEHYDEDLEGQGISGGQDVVNAVAASWGQDDLTVAQISLLADLQDAHDEASRPTYVTLPDHTWSKSIVAALEGVATKFHLRFDPNEAKATKLALMKNLEKDFPKFKVGKIADVNKVAKFLQTKGFKSQKSAMAAAIDFENYKKGQFKESVDLEGASA